MTRMADSIPTPFSDPDVPAVLRPIISRMQATIDTYTAGLLAGEMTPEEWESAMSVLIARYHGTALRAGQGGGGLSEAAQAVLQGLVGVQLAFLANFAHVIRTAGPNLAEYAARFRARALSYALAVKTAHTYGDMIRQTGRVWPVAAVPGQGTQCGSNCLCSLEYQVYDVENGDADIYWRRSTEDSCQTCLERERLWSPMKIRDGRLVVDYAL